MKKFLLISTLMLLLIVSVVSIGKSVTIRYWMWDPSIKAKEQALISAFEKSHPNIKVELTTMEPKNYWPKLSAMSAAKSLPDVFNMSSGYVEGWSSAGLLYRLNDFVAQLDSSKYFPKLLAVTTYNGNTYAFPFAWVTTVLYYNKDMFDEAGLAYPTDDWTWFDFLNAAIRLTKDKNGDGKIDQWGYWFYGRYAHVEPWIYQNGGRLLNEDKTRFDPDANAMETLKFLTDLVLKYKVAPSKKSMTGVRQQDVFPLGMAAMWTDGSWNTENARNIVKGKFRWGIARVPRGPHWTHDITYAWPDSISISAFTKHPEEAWELVKFLTGPAVPVNLFMAGKVPSYKPTAYSEEWLQKDKQPGNMDLILKLGNNPVRTSFTKGWSEWRGYGGAEGMGLNGAIDKVVNGEEDLYKAIFDSTIYVNKVLKRYYK